MDPVLTTVGLPIAMAIIMFGLGLEPSRHLDLSGEPHEQ